MAKPSWITLNKTGGSGNNTFTATAAKHTGREQRTGTITVSGTGVGSNKTISVTQSGASVFGTINSVSVPQGGGSVTISGTSNSDGLYFVWAQNAQAGNRIAWNANNKWYDEDKGAGALGSTYDTPRLGTFKIDSFTGISMSKKFSDGSAAPQGTTGSALGVFQNLGKQSSYTWEITLDFAANTDNVEIYRKLELYQATTNTDVLASLEITQAAGNATLSVSPTTLTFAAAGETKTITVTSNTSWSVS